MSTPTTPAPPALPRRPIDLVRLGSYALLIVLAIAYLAPMLMLLNTAFNGMDPSGHYDPVKAPMFWDLRALSLEAQALEPIKSFEEMRGDAYGEGAALEAGGRRGAIAEHDARNRGTEEDGPLFRSAVLRGSPYPSTSLSTRSNSASLNGFASQRHPL